MRGRVGGVKQDVTPHREDAGDEAWGRMAGMVEKSKRGPDLEAVPGTPRTSTGASDDAHAEAGSRARPPAAAKARPAPAKGGAGTPAARKPKLGAERPGERKAAANPAGAEGPAAATPEGQRAKGQKTGAAMEGAGASLAALGVGAGHPADGQTPPAMKKQRFVERIAGSTGVKKKDAKAVIEATLALMGEALSSGAELNLPPLGKLKVTRAREDGAAGVLVLKLRRGAGAEAKAPEQGLAED